MRGCTVVVIGFGLSCSRGFSCQLDYQKLHPTLQSSTDVFSTFFLAAIASDMYFRTFYPLTHKWRCARCYIDNLDYFQDINRFLSFCIRWLIWTFNCWYSGSGFRVTMPDKDMYNVCSVFFFLIYCEKSNYTCRFQRQNSIWAKSFCTYSFVSMVTDWGPGRSASLPRFLLQYRDSSFHEVSEDYVLNRKPTDIFQKLMKSMKSSIILQDSLPLITFRCASFLMTNGTQKFE